MITRRSFLMSAAAAARPKDKLVVLTFDDAVKSHRTIVAPLLKELGFRATFFVTHQWMADTEYFMSWQDIAELHRTGFEIGNHSWTHDNFSTPRNVARLPGELALVENELAKVGVPRPVSFAYSGNSFGPEAVNELSKAGYRFARRGEMPEQEYGKVVVGPTYDPARYHRLLIPTTGDAYPDWTFEHLKKVVAHARDGQIVVLQFHGVPDVKHPWVHTPPERFREYMQYLKDQRFETLALRDLEPYASSPDDPMLRERHPKPKDGRLRLPVEMERTRADADYWLDNMMNQHHYSAVEAADVFGYAVVAPAPGGARPHILPYPGGRPLRIGFREGAINPLRGTKASVFLPWDPASYAVIDLPEAIFSNLGLLFLAHTHVPTIWNDRNVVIENTDWQRQPDGSLASRWKLPNGVVFGATVAWREREVAMELWLENGTKDPLTRLRTQVCVLLKEARGLNAETNDNKRFEKTVASVGGRIFTEWERCGRTWGNPACPCMHSDPVLPDCAPGETVRVRGRLWFGG